MLFMMSMTSSDKTLNDEQYLNEYSIESSIEAEECEDYAFRQLESYYNNGNTDNFEGGQLFYTALWLCETVFH